MVPILGQDFDVPITVSDGINNLVLTLGVDPQGTDGYDPGLDVLAPPPPPPGAFDARFSMLTEDFLTDIRDNLLTEKQFHMSYQAAAGQGPITLTWDNTVLASLGTFEMVDDITGTLWGPLDMTTTNTLTVTDPIILNGLRIKVTPFPVSGNQPPVVISPIPDQTQLIGFATYTVANLDTVFQDPDNDPLTYSATSDGNTTVSVIGSLLQLGSVPGFVGTSTVIATADDGQFTTNDTFLVVVQDTTAGPCPDFDFPITVTDGSNNQILTIGVDPNGSDGYDPGLDVLAPPPPPPGAFDARLSIQNEDFLTDIRDNLINQKQFHMSYQAATGQGPITLTWDNTIIPSLGTFTIVDDINGTLWGPLDMSTTNTLTVTDPLILNGLRILVTPTCVTPPCIPDVQPIADQTVQEGQTLDVPVVATATDTCAITLSVTNLPAFGTFTDNGDGTGLIHFAPGTGDAGSYPNIQVTGTTADGSDTEVFMLTVTPATPGACPDFDVPITVTDGSNSQLLVFGVDPNGSDGYDPGLDVLAPPPPPPGAFDARFSMLNEDFLTDIRDNLLTQKLFHMSYQPASGQGPIVLHWNISDLDIYSSFQIVDDINGNLFGPVDMKTVDSLVVTDPLILNGLRIILNPGCPGQCLPDVQPIADQTMQEGQTLDVPVVATATDTCAITLTASNVPPFGTFTDNGDGTGLFHFAPGIGDNGLYQNIQVTATTVDGSDVETFNLLVNPQPAPVDSIFISIPDTIKGEAGTIVDVPVYLNVNNNQVAALGAAVVLSKNILTYTGFTPGPIIPGPIFDVQAPAPDSLLMGFFDAGGGPISTSGLLTTLHFQISPSAVPGDTVFLNFNELSASDPGFNALTVIPDNGTFVVTVYIAGNIQYCDTSGNGNPAKPVKDLSAELYQNGNLLKTVLSDSNGNYHINKILVGNNYRLEVHRVSGGIGNNVIVPTDALICFNIFLGSYNGKGCQKLASDVNCDQAVNPTDALLIFNYFLGNISSFPCGEDWRAYPASYDIDATPDAWKNAPNGIDYPSLTDSQPNQDFYAVVYGDADLSWTPLTNAMNKLLADNSNTIDLQLTPANVSDEDRSFTFWLWVDPGSLPNGIYAFGGDLVYDASILNIEKIEWGSILPETNYQYDFSHRLEQETEGIIRFGGFSTGEKFTETGKLLTVKAKVKKEVPDEKPFQISLKNVTVAIDNQGHSPANAQGLLNLRHSGEQITPPATFALLPNYPNPFNPRTVIQYQLPVASQVTVTIYNALGQEIRKLVDSEHRDAGTYKVIWDGKNQHGELVGSGVYFYRLDAQSPSGNYHSTRKMILLR